LIIVWTGALFDQWVERVRTEAGIDLRWVGKVRGSTRVYGPITVAMQQTIAKMREGPLARRHEDYFDRWGLVGADEVHRFGARTFVEAIDGFSARYRVGVSDRVRRKDRKDFLVSDEFGGIACDVTKEELVAKRRVIDVSIRVVPTGWRPATGQEEADALLGARTVDRSDPKVVFDEMGGAEERTAVAVEAAARYAREGHQVLVFSLRRDHCREIDQRLAALGVRTGLLIGGEDFRTAFRETLAGLKGGSVRVGVGTVQAVGTGVDLPAVARGVVAMPIAGDVGQMRQVTGRLCRAVVGKTAELTYLWDEAVWPEHLGVLDRSSGRTEVYLDDERLGPWVTVREYRTVRRRRKRERERAA
ncbi:MAG: hypothetical protein L3J81_04655, partial [Thermoplasmata archaeon]|nr:hypothetical protein [Thermoplasmata archaeon]